MPKNILFINQETTPYSPKTDAAEWSQHTPEEVQAKKRQIRTFMPLWGNISERKGQLHEVIRLSGLEMTIGNREYQLLIKVASVPVSRLQVYFIDNGELFTKRGVELDHDGNDYDDNGDRAIFYARGVLEMVKKLHWIPDVIVCQGWISSVIPLAIRSHFTDDPVFKNSKIVLNMIGTKMQKGFQAGFKQKLFTGGSKIAAVNVDKYSDDFTVEDVAHMAIDYSDAVMVGSKEVNPDFVAYAQEKGLPVFDATEKKSTTSFLEFAENL